MAETQEQRLIRAITEILDVEVEDESQRGMHQNAQMAMIRIILDRHNKRLQKEKE